MEKLTKLVAVMAVIGLMGAGPVAYAMSEGDSSEGGKGFKHGKGQKFEEMAKDLNLTAEQKTKLEAQRKAKMESHKAEREQMKAKMEALHAAIAKPGTTRADVAGLVNEVSALKAQMFSEKIDGLFAMKEVLTPEQFAKMEAKHKERMSKMSKKWGNKGPTEPPQD